MAEIECDALCKSYGDFAAVRDVSFAVEKGEVFGFLGPNGAGKTTTIRLLMGMLVASSGRAMLHGLDCHADRAEAKRFVGYLPDNPAFQDYLRGEEILEFVGAMHGLPKYEISERVRTLLRRFSLMEAADDFAVNYSAGMKRKLALACAQIHEPEVFILDEPTNGLDPLASREVQEWILSSAAEGRTVFLSTHLLDMAGKLCHRVGIIDRGRLLAVGPPGELQERLCPGGSLEEVFFAVTRGGREGGR